MFLSNSRYIQVSQTTSTLPDGTTVAVVKIRRTPQEAGTLTPMTSADRLDVLANQKYGDGTLFWHIADANTDLQAEDLLKPWLPTDPLRPQVEILIPET